MAIYTSLCTLFSFSFAMARIMGHKGDIFKDFAHLWVGWMLGNAVVLSVVEYQRLKVYRDFYRCHCFIALAFTLSVVEVLVATKILG